MIFKIRSINKSKKLQFANNNYIEINENIQTIKYVLDNFNDSIIGTKQKN